MDWCNGAQPTDIEVSAARALASLTTLDASLRTYLESKLGFSTAELARRAFQDLTMETSRGGTHMDVDEALGRYEVGFSKLIKKSESFHFRDASLAKWYVAGIRPNYVRDALYAELDRDGTSLNSIKALTRTMVKEDERHRHRDADRDKAQDAKSQSARYSIKWSIEHAAVS